MTVEEVQQTIRTGQHPGWQKAVHTFLSGKTQQLKLHIAETYLIFSYRVTDDWFSALAPLRREKPYEQIADYHRETRGLPTCARLTWDGGVELQTPGDDSLEPVIAMFPIGLLFIGQSKRGIWGDEEAYANFPILAEILGRPEEQVLRELDALVIRYANRRIREITGAGDKPMTILDSDSGKVVALTGRFSPPQEGPVN